MPASSRFLIPVLFAVSAYAQSIPRITRAIVDESDLVTLAQKPHPLARQEFDRGSAPATLPMDRMMIILKRTPEQTTQLKTLLDSQLRASSPQFHQWLTPEQFGGQFGASDHDLETITGWLQSHGFVVESTAKSKSAIQFSGNAQQISEAFHTAIHRFVVKGKEYWSNTNNPRIPSALAPVVAGVTTLNSFHPHAPALSQAISSGPLYTSSDGSHALAPADYATIYNINPLYKAGIDGTGATIAVVGTSAPDPQDLSDFREKFGAKVYQPQLNYPYGQPTDTSGAGEATLDVTWSGAIAPGAAINFVAIPDTFADSGLLLSELYIVDNNLGDIVTESFSSCEAYSDDFLNNFIESVREQAAAQGMTYIVSAGDSGPYGCDDFDDELTVADPNLVSINLLAASPYVTAVGGTMFNEAANPSQFWSAPSPKPFGTALSYIPEVVWQQSCDSPFCFLNILAGSGGQSSVYPKPSWQSGVTGIQPDGTRDVPDVALTASSHDPYLVCFNGSCEGGYFYGFSGTSAAGPSLAGMMALLRQKVGGRLGAINPQLYALAGAESYASCNGSADAVGSTCIFNDITIGNNAVNGEPNFGTPSALYQATAGYDLASGLGSINAANLINKWSISGEKGTTASLTISPTTLRHGGTANMTISVAAKSGSGVPTGPVDLSWPSGSLGSFPLSGGMAESTMPPLAGGSYSVSALYGGDGTFAASSSNSVTVSVSPEPSQIFAEADTPCAVGPFCPFTGGPYGSSVMISAVVSGYSGVGAPSGSITFTDNGGTGGVLQLNNDGSSGFAANPFPVGTHTIAMTYPGDASFSSVTATPFSFSIAPAPTFLYVEPSSFCGLPSTPFPVTAELNWFGIGTYPTGTFTLLSTNPQITATVESGGFFTIPALPGGFNNLVVSYSGDSNYLPSVGTAAVNITSGACLAAMVNAADYQPGVAPQEIVSIFGLDLASSTVSATVTPLPQTLGGTSVAFTDQFGNTEAADLFFVSTGQINCAVPYGLATGPATVQITSPQGVSEFPVEISYFSPALFSADGSGTGLASAQILRDHQGVYSTTSLTSTPIAFNGDNLYLILFGTGSFNVSPSDSVQVLFNGEAAIPTYVGAQGSDEGLDQINVPIPTSLAGAGSVSVQLLVDGLISNAVTVSFQ